MNFTTEQTNVCNEYVQQISQLLNQTDKTANDIRLSFWCKTPTLKIDDTVHKLNESTIWPTGHPHNDWVSKNPFIDYIIKQLDEHFNIQKVIIPRNYHDIKDDKLVYKYTNYDETGYVYHKITL